MHGRSCSHMTVDPRIPVGNVGAEHVGVSPTRGDFAGVVFMAVIV